MITTVKSFYVTWVINLPFKVDKSMQKIAQSNSIAMIMVSYFVQSDKGT